MLTRNDFVLITELIQVVIFFIIVINLGYPQCAGDVNLDNTVDGADVFIIVNHIFDTDPIEGDGFNNGDINGTTTIDIYDLVAIVHITLLPEDDCAGFLPIDLSLDWQIQDDPSYFDFEVLDEIVNEEIAQLQYIRGIIVIHQGKIVSEQYFNNSSMDQVFNIWSVTKSYISTLIGQVIDEGLIPNQFVTLDSIFVQNSNTTQVTLENLLTMTSGWPENWSYMYIQNTLSFLLNTDFVPTNCLPLAGLRPQTIAGAPSIFTDMLLSAQNQSNTLRSPVRMLSSGCSMCVFFIVVS